jgi:hypothetical protein
LGHYIYEHPDSILIIGTPHLGFGQLFVQCFKNSLFKISAEFSFFFIIKSTFYFALSLSPYIKSNLFIGHLLKGWVLSLQSRQNLKSQNVQVPIFYSLSKFAIYEQLGSGHHPISSI